MPREAGTTLGSGLGGAQRDSMAATGNRRPFPAIAFLLILSLLAAVVWWRVLHRADQDSTTTTTNNPTCSTQTAKASALPAPKSIKVTVLNGNGRSGLAESVGKQLKSRGFKSVVWGNDDSTVSGVGDPRLTSRDACT